MESTRLKKISRLLQKELAEIFRLQGPGILPGKMISVTVVRVSPDLGLAKVYLSVFPLQKDEQVLKDIELHKSNVKNDLGNRIKNQVRKIPDLYFYIDDSLDYMDNIDRLLKS
jgi:ribosome-binding factor A